MTDVVRRRRKRPGRPPGEATSARDRILQSARELFSEVGYERASFTEIAQRSGVTRPAVSYHFRTKKSLYAALLESTREGVVAPGVRDAATQTSLPARLIAFVEAASQVDSRDRSYARFIASSVLDGFRHPELREHSQVQLDELRAFVRRSLVTAVEDGEIRAGTDVTAVTEMLVAVMWGMGLYAGYLGTHDQLEAAVSQFGRLLRGELW